MTRPNDFVTGVIIGIVAIYLVGCQPPLGTDGVQCITPRGQAWSHVSGMSWSPDGSKLALTWTFGGGDLVPEGYVYVVDLEKGEPRILTHTKVDHGEVFSPAWSPTSDQIAFFTSEWEWNPGGILLANADDKGPPTLLGEGIYCAWDPDGEQIAIADFRMDYTIYVLNTRTSERRELVRISNEGKYAHGAGISWSPTGDQLAFSFGLDDHNASTTDTMSIYDLSLASRNSHLLVQGGWNQYPSWSPDGTMLAFSGGDSWQEQTLVIMRMDDGSTIRPLDVIGVGPVAWSPDGSAIAFEWKGSVYTIDTAVALQEWLDTED